MHLCVQHPAMYTHVVSCVDRNAFCCKVMHAYKHQRGRLPVNYGKVGTPRHPCGHALPVGLHCISTSSALGAWVCISWLCIHWVCISWLCIHWVCISWLCKHWVCISWLCIHWVCISWLCIHFDNGATWQRGNVL
jgi:hypothetical protein